ncbi:putative Ribonuclease T2-like protein [Glarea lozoyensis 74030]|uniref:ribonuclease T2 n=1 Tax=Glarea lozoyensis (strain ATCC 74030 / MF5533) TaxID=1104152 RepID=H0ELH4_GLAL7|nr:putative Ribonuclease T2-like protein [Glarea lozoyensis 74030]
MALLFKIGASALLALPVALAVGTSKIPAVITHLEANLLQRNFGIHLLVQCDGTYDASCDSSRAYTGIGSILTSLGKSSLLSYMNTYWKDVSGDDESFWEHEWSKHGTCVSTLAPACYSGYTSKQEVGDYFQKAVDIFKTRDTYGALTAAGITPSSTKTYTSAAIQAALKAAFGVTAIIQCDSSALNEVWYSFYVKGSVATGTFVATNPPLRQVGVLFKTRGELRLTYLGSGVTLSTSKGACGIVSGVFTCASGVASTVFTSSSGYLAYGGSTNFYATAVPSGSTQATVYTASKAVSVKFAWLNK